MHRSGLNLIREKSDYIGVDYEKHLLPNILFVFLDPDSNQSFENLEKRTPEGVLTIEKKPQLAGIQYSSALVYDVKIRSIRRH